MSRLLAWKIILEIKREKRMKVNNQNEKTERDGNTAAYEVYAQVS